MVVRLRKRWKNNGQEVKMLWRIKIQKVTKNKELDVVRMKRFFKRIRRGWLEKVNIKRLKRRWIEAEERMDRGCLQNSLSTRVGGEIETYLEFSLVIFYRDEEDGGGGIFLRKRICFLVANL
jgi:hypothetical protein